MRAVSWTELSQLVADASKIERKRKVLVLHDEDETINVLYNAIWPESYIMPHKHEDKKEYFQVVDGEFLVITFNDKGGIINAIYLQLPTFRYEDAYHSTVIPVNTWHTVISITPGIIIEEKTGPYNPETAKTFAPWAPQEGESGCEEYRENLLREALTKYFPHH